MNINLQKATKDDWKIIREFMKDAESRTFHATTDEKAIQNLIEKDEVFIIIYEGKKVGIIAHKPQKNSNYLSELIIAPAYQGKGIAIQAISKLLDKIGNNKRTELHTHPDNKPAIKTYWKLGFQIKGWKDNYYGDGEPRILLIRERQK